MSAPVFCRTCGAYLTEGVRYEATRTVRVRICFRDGYEWPALYPRTSRRRNGEHRAGLAPDPMMRACEECGDTFTVPRPAYPARFCGLLCIGRYRARLGRTA